MHSHTIRIFKHLEKEIGKKNVYLFTLFKLRKQPNFQVCICPSTSIEFTPSSNMGSLWTKKTFACLSTIPGDPEEPNIKLAGMKVTCRIRTLSRPASRRPSEIGHSAGWNAGHPKEQDIQLAGMQETKRNRTFSWLEWRRPTGIGHSTGRNPGDPEGEDIQLAGMQETNRNRTFCWKESREPRGRGHSAGWNAGDPQE